MDFPKSVDLIPHTSMDINGIGRMEKREDRVRGKI